MPGSKYIPRISLFFFILIFSLKLNAQEPHFKTFELPTAFSDCKINGMVQDETGMIWLGTYCGLLYFDGIHFELYSVITGEITSLDVMAHGGLFVGTDQGEIFKIGNLTSKSIKVKATSPDQKIVSIVETKTGNIWYADYGSGLGRINGTDTLMLTAENSGLQNNYIYDLVYANQKLWVASDAGIQIISESGNDYDFELLTMEDGLPDVMIQYLEPDQKGTIWAGGYDGGFCSIDPESGDIIKSTADQQWGYGPVTGILPLRNEIWVATGKSGLLKMDTLSKNILQFRNFSDHKISRFSGLMHLQSGDLMAWSGNKIVHVPSLHFEFVRGNETNALKDVHALMTDSKGFIWYAAENGLFRHTTDFSGGAKSQRIPLPESFSYRDITCLHQDPEDFVWVGTFGEGLYRLDPGFKTGRIFNTQNGFVNDNILSISSNQDEIWFATLGGASRVVLTPDSPHKIQFEDFDKSGGLGNNFIYCVLSDSKKRIWFATDGTGITLLEGGQFRNFGLESGLTSEKVYTIAEDNDGGIWCATHDNKVFHFDDGRFAEVDAGLEGNFTISSLEADKNGNLIIVHENGITIYDIDKESAVFYGENYGIQPIDPEFNSTTKSPDGAIWIGTDDGLIKYLPGSKDAGDAPAPVITSVKVLFEPIDFNSRRIFKHDQNYLTFSYAGLWFQQPDVVKYRVKLEGNDLDWIKTGDREITYSRLSPGEYRFMVEASVNEHFKNARLASYSFTIQKPFWATTWFFLAVAFFSGLLIWLIFKARMRRLENINAIQQEKIRYQFETLRSQVNPHFLFNSFSTLMTSIEEDKNQALEYVEKLSTFFRNMLEMRDKNLITLHEELQIAENYIYLQKSRYGENLSVEISIDSNARKTMIPPLTLQLLIENAIKHNIISKLKPLHISIVSNQNQLVISNNLQKKNFVEISTGFGLKTIRHRYDLLGDSRVEILEESDKFVVRLPLLKNEML